MRETAEKPAPELEDHGLNSRLDDGFDSLLATAAEVGLCPQLGTRFSRKGRHLGAGSRPP